MEKAYRKLGYFLLLLVPLVAIAFHNTYGSKFPNFRGIFDGFVHTHVFLASLWLLMLIIQPFFIVYKKRKWHKAIGKASYIILPLLILSFLPGIIKAIDAEKYLSLFFTVADAITLLLFYLLAMYYRKSPPKHMRYIIASSLILLGPTIGRIGPQYYGLGEVETQGIIYAIIFSILLGLTLYDWKNGKNYKPYLVGICLFLIHAIGFYYLVFTGVS